MDRHSANHPPKQFLLDPTNDVVWKLLLTAPHRSHLLLSFVNAVLRLKQPFTSLEVLNPEVSRQLVASKASVLDILVELSEDREARELARIREKGEHDWASSIDTARREGLKKGLARGLKKGRAEGKAEGKAEGERNAQLHFLKAMLLNPQTSSLSDETIARMTNLSVDAVRDMRSLLSKKNTE